MSYAPPSLLALRRYLSPRTRLSPISLGIVGDAAHARRPSYHNGRDAVERYGRTPATDYTIRTPRDRRGLSGAASAIDIGRFPRLRTMSVWLVNRARQGSPDTADIREIIYSPDGRRVLRWDRERGVGSTPRAGEADDSHLTHTHISWYRDSEHRDKVGPFRSFFEPVRWGADVDPAIQRAYSAVTVARKLRELGQTFGEHINNVDLEAGLRRRGITFGTSVQLVDVKALMRAGPKPV